MNAFHGREQILFQTNPSQAWILRVDLSFFFFFSVDVHIRHRQRLVIGNLVVYGGSLVTSLWFLILVYFQQEGHTCYLVSHVADGFQGMNALKGIIKHMNQALFNSNDEGLINCSFKNPWSHLSRKFIRPAQYQEDETVQIRSNDRWGLLPIAKDKNGWERWSHGEFCWILKFKTILFIQQCYKALIQQRNSSVRGYNVHSTSLQEQTGQKESFKSEKHHPFFCFWLLHELTSSKRERNIALRYDYLVSLAFCNMCCIC